MVSLPRAARRPAFSQLAGAMVLALAAGLPVSITPAAAQSVACDGIQPLLVQRKSIADKLSAAGKKKIDARVACTGFTQLVANGAAIVKFVDMNKDWCQIPDSFATGVKADHSKAVAIRARACTFVAKQAEAEKRAKSGNGGGGGGLLGGGGLTGQLVMPQGAL
jgi:hypothetical protein